MRGHEFECLHILGVVGATSWHVFKFSDTDDLPRIAYDDVWVLSVYRTVYEDTRLNE